eukprot:Tbor_TRINITY_DN4497_c1_g1::TRINITY_DN4497_c1_g1_i1::g.8085::m.8085/K13249/SSR1; translocon-associated protein subunit alpha
MALIRLVAVSLVVSLMLSASAVKADDDIVDYSEDGNDDEEEFNSDEDDKDSNDGLKGVEARVYFSGHKPGTPLVFPAGEKVKSYVSFQNKMTKAHYNVFIVAAHINRLGDPSAFLQNFSAVSSLRTVKEGSSATIKYNFVPDVNLEPMDYNLVVRMFFLNDENTTFAAVAYNSTVTIGEPLGTDPKTVMTFIIIFAILSAIIYYIMNRKSTRRIYKKKSTDPFLAGTNDYNESDIPAEHLQYKKALLASKGSRGSSPKLKAN